MKSRPSVISMDTVILFLSIMGYVTLATSCPDLCKCNFDYFVYCKNADIGARELQSIMKNMSEEVRYLDFGFNRITHLPPKIFSDLPNLRTLSLVSNQITTIPADVFKNLPNMEELNMNTNRIHEVTASPWKQLPTLLKLDLGHNVVDFVDPYAFVSLVNLTDLNLDHNHIGAVEERTFTGLKSLVTLNLSHNILQRIDNGSFKDLKRLESLDLTNNILNGLHSQTFTGLQKLRTLNMNFNKIQDLEKMSFADFHRSLMNLYVCNNELTHLQESVFSNFRYLRELYLDHNLIESISHRAFLGLYLEKLSVSHNKLTSLTREMFRQLRGVTYVDFSHNWITSLSTGVFDSFRDSVLTVRMDHNYLSFIHHGHFRRMKHLQCLNLTKNVINRIEEQSFQDLHDLEDLVLSENELETVNPKIVHGLKLRHLYLMCNPLKHFKSFTNDLARSRPLTVHMNLTVEAIDLDTVLVTWPYKEGSHIYWTLQVTCLDGKECGAQSKEEYLAPFKTNHMIVGLSPLMEYYICVNPVFVSDHVHIHQCIILHPSAPAVTTETAILATEPLTANISPIPVISSSYLGCIILLTILHCISCL